MEIEKKYRVKNLPKQLEQYEKKEIEQGYLCTNPVVRIRKSNNEFILTYKSKIGLDTNLNPNLCISNEVEVPLTEESYYHLRKKIDYYLVVKTRYIIPLENGLNAELDIFHERLEGLVFAEVEFPDEKTANSFLPPNWFSEDISKDRRFKNNYLASIETLDLL